MHAVSKFLKVINYKRMKEKHFLKEILYK